MDLKLWSFPFVLSALLTLGGCSASSSGGDNDDNEQDDSQQPPEQVERISLTGLAIKGLSKGAAINVYPTNEDADGFSSTSIGTGASNDKGEYQLLLDEDYSDYSGVVKVVLSYQDGAQLECDNLAGAGDAANACGTGKALGEFYDMPSDFSLSAIAELNAGSLSASGANIINLTALTTLSASYIENGDPAGTGSINTDAVKRGNNQIRAVLGLPSVIDLTSSRPANVNTGTDSGDGFYGAINASFQALAAQPGNNLTDVIDNFASAFSDGQIIAKTGSAVQDSDITLANLLEKANNLAVAGVDLTKLSNIISATPSGQQTSITPPAISLGNNQIVTPGQSITLTAATLTGTPTSYKWFYAGDAANPLQDDASASYQFTTPASATTLSIQVIATDADGLTDTDIIVIDVREATSAASAIVGEYYLSNSQTEFARYDDGSNFWYDINVDTSSQPGTMNVADLNGTAVINIPTGATLDRNFWAGIQTADLLPLTAEQKNQNDPGQSFIVTPLASGNLRVDVPAMIDVDDMDAEADVNEAFRINFIEVAPGSYIGRGLEFNKTYSYQNGNIEYNNQVEENAQINNILISKTNDNGGLATLNGKTYVGFRHGTVIRDGIELEISLDKQVIEFTNTSGALTINEDNVRLLGLPNKANTESNDTFSMQEDLMLVDNQTAQPIQSFANGRIASLESGAGIGNSALELFVSGDGSAVFGLQSFWLNQNESETSYDSQTPMERESAQLLLLEKPAAAIDLNGKVFGFHVSTHYAGVPEIPGSVDPKAGEFSIAYGTGTLKFEGGKAKFSLTENDFFISYPNNDISQQPSLGRNAQPVQSNWEFDLTNSGITDANGCIELTDSMNTDTVFGVQACTNGETIMVREYASSFQSKSYLSFVIGKRLQ